jgi:membrane protein DedA with SNARE-associated domain
MFAPLLAGSLKIRWITFQIYDILALIFYASLFIFLGFHFHNQLALIISDLAVIRHILFLIIISLLGIGIAVFTRKKYINAN